MKKLFYFASSSGNGTDKQVHCEKATDSKMKSQASSKAEQEFNSPKSQGEVSGHRRSLSLSLAGFLFDKSGKASTNDLTSATKSKDRERNHSSRCFTPETQFQHDSSGSSSSCSSKVLDRYIDGEKHLELCKKKSGSSQSDVSGSRRLPPPVQWTVSTSPSDTFNGKRKAHSFREVKESRLRFSSTDCVEDVYGGSPLDSSSDVAANVSLYIQEDIDSELEMKINEAEKRLKLFSEELEQQRCLSDCDFDVSSLVGAIRKLQDERLNLAFENVNILQSQMAEKASAREEIRRVKSDWDLHIQRVEKERKLRERARELAEQNVSLQREVLAFHENETQNKEMKTHLERRVAELNTRAEELHEENSYLKQTLSQLQESYADATEDLEFLRRNIEDKDQECRELHKSVAKFLRTCEEQGKTIEGLRDCVSEEGKKQSSEKLDHLVEKLQVEQIRLTGIELSLRKEVESMKLETESLRHENICLLNRLKGNGDITALKLESEMKMRVCYMQEQGLSMLNESNQVFYKLLKFIKGKLSEFPETCQDRDSMKEGLGEQFMIESETKVNGIRRGTENLKRSLQTVASVVASNSESSCSSTGRPMEQRNQSVEETLRAELRAETLITSLLREKLYSKEEEIEQLQAQVAAAVRGNEILKSEVQRSSDNLSVKTDELKDLKLQMLKKEENISWLEINLEEAAKNMAGMKAFLQNVCGEGDQIWRELRQSCEKNIVLSSENETLKGRIEKLEEKILEKEGEMTILQDTIRSKHLNLLSSLVF